MKICMVGAGYVGLVSAACFAEFGWTVTCVDKDADRIASLKKGEVPIYEPGLDALLQRNGASARISFSTILSTAVNEADLVFLAVGTPMRRGDGYADLTYVFEAVEEIAPHLSEIPIIATKSTVPVGTSREIKRRLHELRPDVDAIAKYAANAFLAMKVTFINEVADLCEAVGADVQEVATAIGADGRIGSKFLHAGPGYGGSCFPKDVTALIRTAREAKAPLSLVEQVEKVNTERKIAMAGRITTALGGSVRNKTVAVLGVTFKPDTDDMRDAPSLVILPMLQARGARIRAYDPQGRSKAEDLLPNVEWCEGPLTVAEGANALVVLTEWNEFRALDLKHLRQVMGGNVLVDLRNMHSKALAEEAGFTYFGVGRTFPSSSQQSDSDRALTPRGRDIYQFSH